MKVSPSDLNIKNDDFRPLGVFFKKKPRCPKLGDKFVISDSIIFFALKSENLVLAPYFGQF